MNKTSRILVFDQNDLIGYSLFNKLKVKHYRNIIDSSQLNLYNLNSIKQFIYATKPEYVVLTRNRDINYEYIINLLLDINIKNIIYLSDKNKNDPIVNKFRDKITTVLFDEIYGDYDKYHYNDASIIPYLVRNMHENMVYNVPITYIEIDNNRKRNFIHTEDMNNILIYILNNYKKGDVVNLITGSNINIKCLGSLIKEIIGYDGELNYLEPENDKNIDKPNKIVYSKIQELNWYSKIKLYYGIKKTYKNLLDVHKYFLISTLTSQNND